MATRRVIVGAIGGKDETGVGSRLGTWIAQGGHVLLTGGDASPSDEIKNCAHVAARDSKSTSRRICVMPGRGPSVPPNLSVSDQVFTANTGLTSLERDCINGEVPDIVVALIGGNGTLIELAYAARKGRKIRFCGSAEKLKEKAEKRWSNCDDKCLRRDMQRSLAYYEELFGQKCSTDELYADLIKCLKSSKDVNETELQAEIEASKYTESGLHLPKFKNDAETEMFRDAIQCLTAQEEFT